MTPEQQDQLDASALAVVTRAARVGFDRVAERMQMEEAKALQGQLAAGAHLEVRIRMTTPPAVRVVLVNGHDETIIGEIVTTLPKDRLQ